jgi:hypothetical protein
MSDNPLDLSDESLIEEQLLEPSFDDLEELSVNLPDERLASTNAEEEAFVESLFQDANSNLDLRSPIYNAIKNDDVEAMRLIVLENPSLNLSRLPGHWPPSTLCTPTFYCFRFNSWKMFHFLIDLDVDLEQTWDRLIPGMGSRTSPSRTLLSRASEWSFQVFNSSISHTCTAFRYYIDWVSEIFRCGARAFNPNLNDDCQAPIFLRKSFYEFSIFLKSFNEDTIRSSGAYSHLQLASNLLFKMYLQIMQGGGGQREAAFIMHNVRPEAYGLLIYRCLRLNTNPIFLRHHNLTLLIDNPTTQKIFDLLENHRQQRLVAVAGAYHSRSQSRLQSLPQTVIRRIANMTTPPYYQGLRLHDCPVCLNRKNNTDVVCKHGHELCATCRAHMLTHDQSRCPMCRAPMRA